MPGLKRLKNILRYGFGAGARARKRAAKEKHRAARFAAEAWNREGALVSRRYDSYEEYVEHQASKLDRVRHRLSETQAEDLAEFQRRFALSSALAQARRVLCLGARVGTEVRALTTPGRLAIGIDLNPGENNPWVLPGDFHRVQFADLSIDAVYTNCLDHVFDLDRLLGEVRRLLTDEGAFVTDVLPGFEEGWTPGDYEATHWPRIDALVARIEQEGGFLLEERRDLGTHRRDPWTQLVFRKGSAPRTPVS